MNGLHNLQERQTILTCAMVSQDIHENLSQPAKEVAEK